MHILIIILSLLSIGLLIRNYYLTSYIDELEYTMIVLARRFFSEEDIEKLKK